MASAVKIRLLQIGKKQVDLLTEIRKRGYPNLGDTQLSKYVNGRDITPQARAVKKIIEQILDEWEQDIAQ